MAQGGSNGQRLIPCWISDLMSINWKALEGQPAPSVFSIMGVILAVTGPADPTSEGGLRRPVGYHVDDGTGVIRVAHFLGSRRIAAQNATNMPTRVTSAVAVIAGSDDNDLRALAQSTKRLYEDSRCELPVGTTIEVVGRLQRGFRGGPHELLAQSVRVARPTHEVDRAILLEETHRPRDSYPRHLFQSSS